MSAERELRLARHTCPLCEAACGLEIAFDGDRVVRIRGARDDVHSHGFICPKGAALKELHHDPDRLRRPLVKRDGELVEVSFDEAFDEIERRLIPIRDHYGPASTGLLIGNPTVHRTGMVLYVLDLAAALGSPNVFSAASLDQMPKQLAVGRLFGDVFSVPVPDIDRCDLLVVIGANPHVSNGSMWSVPDYPGRADALRARGGEIVVVDPRRTETADHADHHLPIRPGTDVYLLAAVTHTLFAEGLVSLGRLEPYVSGLAEVERAVTPFTPEEVADRCGLPADRIRWLARRLAAPRAAIHGRIGTCLQPYGTAVSWLIDVIHALTGNLDEPGGAMFGLPPAFASNAQGEPGRGPGIEVGRYHSRVSHRPEVTGQFPVSCLAEEIETPGEGRLRALVSLAANPALSAPDSTRTRAALEQLDLLVCFSAYLDETAALADVVLPARSPLAESHYDVYFSPYAAHHTARFSPAVVDDPECPPDWQLMVRLIAIAAGDGARADVDEVAERLLRAALAGVPPEFHDGIVAALGTRRGDERVLDLALRTGPYGDQFGMAPDGISLDTLIAAPDGIDLGPLQPRLPDALRTSSGTVELAHADLIGELARARAELGEPTPASPHTFTLLGRRQLRSNNSWMHNVPSLVRGRARCTLEVHPDDAADLGLGDGETARLRAATGAATGTTVEAVVRIDDRVPPGVVSLPHGWGHDRPGTRQSVASQHPGTNLNALTDADRFEHLTGTAVLTGFEVTVEPA